MQVVRPTECPACGHERVVRRPHELHTETGKLRVKLMKWGCGLCGYQWSRPARRMLVDDWERA